MNLNSFAYESHKNVSPIAIISHLNQPSHTSPSAAPLTRSLILRSSATNSHIVTCCTCRRSWSCSSLCIDDPLLDLASQLEERLFHANVALCTDFHERNAELICKSLTLRSADLALFFPVAFVADQDLVDAFRCMLLDVGEPGAYVCDGSVCEALLGCSIRYAVVAIVHGRLIPHVVEGARGIECEAATAARLAASCNIAALETSHEEQKDKLTVEAPLIRDIIHKQYTHRASIIRCCDRPEPFLSSRIPYLQFHALAIEFYCADLEVYANRRDE